MTNQTVYGSFHFISDYLDCHVIWKCHAQSQEISSCLKATSSMPVCISAALDCNLLQWVWKPIMSLSPLLCRMLCAVPRQFSASIYRPCLYHQTSLNKIDVNSNCSPLPCIMYNSYHIVFVLYISFLHNASMPPPVLMMAE